MERIAERFRDCGLELHPDKTRIVYCKDSNRRGTHSTIQFTFLGFTFRPRLAVSRAGAFFSSFQPAVSREAQQRMRQTIHSWHLPRQTPGTLEELSQQYNVVLKGWWQYYGAFSPSAMQPLFLHFDCALAFWARRKYKMHRRFCRSHDWVSRVARKRPSLFVHWQQRAKQRWIVGAV
jgi:hypothetical protein